SITEPLSWLARAASRVEIDVWKDCVVIGSAPWIDDGQFARKVGQEFNSVGRHSDRFGYLAAEAVEPHARDQVEGHVLLQQRVFAAAEADRSLAPVRREAAAHRVAEPRFLFKTARVDHPCEGPRNLVRCRSRTDQLESGLDALDGRRGHSLQRGARLA